MLLWQPSWLLLFYMLSYMIGWRRIWLDGVVFKLRSLDPSQQGGETEKKFWANLSVTRVVPFLCVLHIGSLYKILFNGPLIFFFFFWEFHFTNTYQHAIFGPQILTTQIQTDVWNLSFWRWHIYPVLYPNELVFVTQRLWGNVSAEKKKKRKITEGIFP